MRMIIKKITKLAICGVIILISCCFINACEQKKPPVTHRKSYKQKDLEEWEKLRNNEDKYRKECTFVSWNIKIKNIRRGSYGGRELWGWLEDDTGYEVEMDVTLSEASGIHENDWLRVSGMFKRVSSSGCVVLDPTSISNSGFKSR